MPIFRQNVHFSSQYSKATLGLLPGIHNPLSLFVAAVLHFKTGPTAHQWKKTRGLVHPVDVVYSQEKRRWEEEKSNYTLVPEIITHSNLAAGALCTCDQLQIQGELCPRLRSLCAMCPGIIRIRWNYTGCLAGRWWRVNSATRHSLPHVQKGGKRILMDQNHKTVRWECSHFLICSEVITPIVYW